MSVAPELAAFVKALPTPYLLLSPAFVIEAVSEAYLAATLSRRERLVGHYLFDVFPDNPLTPEAQSVHNLRASLSQVLATGQPHAMAQQHYDVPDPARPGQFIERHWQPLNTPMLDTQGQVVYLIHSARDVTADVQAQAHLRESQAAEQAARADTEVQRQRFYDLLMQLPAQVAVHEGADHIFTLVNPGYQRLAPGRDLFGQAVRAAWPELVSQGILDVLDQVYRTGEPFFGQELPFQVDVARTGQATQLYLNAFFLPLRDAQGQVRGVLDFSYDVTEQVTARQRVEQLNQELETRVQQRTGEALALQADLLAATQRQAAEREGFYQLFEQTTAVVGVVRGASHRVDYVNPAFQRLFGDRQLVGQDYAQAIPEAVTQGFIALLDQVYQTGETFLGNEWPFTPTPTAGQVPRPGYFNFTYQPYREAGEVVGVNIFAFDATEQVLARQEREGQRQRLNDVFEQAPVAICVFQGPAYVLDVVNPRMLQLWDCTRESLVGRPFLEAFPGLRTQGVPELLAAVRRTGQSYAAQEMEFHLAQHQPGETGYYDFVYEPLRDAHGQVEAVLSIATDVTAQVRARQQVEQLNRELEARVQQRTQQLEAARAATERERALLQALLTQAPVAIALLQGEDLRVVSANALIAALWGYTPAQVVGRPLLEGVPELQGQGFDDLLRQVLRTQVPFTGTETPAVMLRDGQLQTSYFNFVYQPLYEADEQLLGVIVVAVDVTEQVRTRQQVEQLNQELEARVQQRTGEALALQADLLAAAQQQAQARETFYQVFAQTPAAICFQRGPTHRFEYANAAYLQFFPGREVLGQDAAVAVPEIVDSGVLALLDHVYQTGETYHGYELPLLLAQPAGPPRQLYFTFTYQAYRENGEIVGISTFAYNVAEQVLARQAQEAQQIQFRELFEQAPVAIAVFEGPDYIVEIANPLVAELWGRTPAQVVGRPLFEALPEIDPGFRPLLDRVVRTGEPYAAQEVATPLLRNGQVATVYLNFVYEPLRDATGTVTRVAAVATDVTEQVQDRHRVQELNDTLLATNAELGSTNTQLVRTNVDLDNFIYTASHDLKAPISNIEGLLLALEHELPAAGRVGDVPQMLGMMQEATERFQRTIGHLTDVSRLQKEHNPVSEPVSLAAVVEAVRLDLLPLLAQSQAQLDVQVPASLTVTFSEKNLRSVVYNLLSNAVKYRHPDRVPQVRLHSWSAQGYQVLEVQDNGLGLDLAQGQDKLFALFQRLHTHVEGTGIGLYMVKRMLENAGGRIEVASQLGQGTTFRVYFQR